MPIKGSKIIPMAKYTIEDVNRGIARVDISIAAITHREHNTQSPTIPIWENKYAMMMFENHS